MSDDVITVERLERALVLCAYLIELDGPIMIPMFERIERDLAALRQTQDTVARAKALLDTLQQKHLTPSLEAMAGEEA
jgi:hypothetical protein